MPCLNCTCQACIDSRVNQISVAVHLGTFITGLSLEYIGSEKFRDKFIRMVIDRLKSANFDRKASLKLSEAPETHKLSGFFIDSRYSSVLYNLIRSFDHFPGNDKAYFDAFFKNLKGKSIFIEVVELSSSKILFI